MVSTDTHRKTKRDVVMHRVSCRVHDRPELGVKSSIVSRIEELVVVQTNVHSNVFVQIETKRKVANWDKRNCIFVVTDAQVADFPINLQLGEELAELLIAKEGRCKRDVGDQSKRFVHTGASEGKQGTQRCPKGVAGYNQGIIIEFCLVEEIGSEHANDLFTLRLGAAVRSHRSFVEQVVIETFMDTTKFGFIFLLDLGNKSRQHTVLHVYRQVLIPVPRVRTSTEDDRDLLIRLVYNDGPYQLYF
mmetsp:Transcript_7606/g.15642  ORF Transcript_7606/g.15642 Transcript_7606/m.15642 type:complete len:246 (-) Transcript_7606:872-1609(-)